MTEIEPARAGIVLRPQEPRPVAYSDADYTISEETAADILAADAPNTVLAYDRNWRAFGEWCARNGRVIMPATAQTLTEYVRQLCSSGAAPATVSQVIGTIRSKHRRAGFKGQPDTEQTMLVLRTHRKAWAAAGGRARKAPPVLIAALRAMVQTCDPETPAGVRDRSLLLTGFNGMFRRSELSGLDIGNISSAGEEGMTVFLAMSKTDQDAQGVAVKVPYGQHRPTCAVRATRAWIDLMAERGLSDGALYRPVDRHGRVGGERDASGHRADRLTGAAISAIVRRRAVLAGVDDADTFSGHSLRSGSATSAYLKHAPVSTITEHGRWAENSPVVLGYIRAVDGWDSNPMKGIGL